MIESTPTAAEQAAAAREQFRALERRSGDCEVRIARLKRDIEQAASEEITASAESLLATGDVPKPSKQPAAIQKQIVDAEREARAIQAAIEIARHDLIAVENAERVERTASALPGYSASVAAVCDGIRGLIRAVESHDTAVEDLREQGLAGTYGLSIMDPKQFTHHGDRVRAWLPDANKFMALAVASGYWTDPEQPEPPPATAPRPEPSSAEQPSADAPAEFQPSFWTGEPTPALAPPPVEWQDGFWTDTEMLVDASKPVD